MTPIQYIGWVASVCFAVSGLPAAVDAIINKECTMPLGTLMLWTVGEICALIYVIPKRDKPLIVNYLANLVFLIIMWYYK